MPPPKGQRKTKYKLCGECGKAVLAQWYRNTKNMCWWCFEEKLRIRKYLDDVLTEDDMKRIKKVREQLKWASLIRKKKCKECSDYEELGSTNQCDKCKKLIKRDENKTKL